MEKTPSELLAPIVKEVYSDAVAPAFREFGKIGADAVKVFRLALFPVQYGAMLQDRLGRYLELALNKVPEERRVTPRDAIMLPVAEKLRHQDEDGNPTAALYVNLLARAMDRERLGDAHPAFVNLIGQLAPDEILILLQLSEQKHRTFVRLAQGDPVVATAELVPLLAQSHLGDHMVQSLLDTTVEAEKLAQPDLFMTFLGHLVSLGLAEYTNIPRSYESREFSLSHLGFEHFYVQLTEFGRLFHRACIAQQIEDQRWI